MKCASVTCKINQNGFSADFGGYYGFAVISKLRFYGLIVMAEYLGAHGRREGAYGLERCTPEAGNQPCGKGQRYYAGYQTCLA